MPYLRYDDAVEALRKAVEVRGADFVYPADWRSVDIDDACMYTVDGVTGACVVGQVLYDLGVDMGELVDWVGSVGQTLSIVGIEADDAAISLLQRAQNNQDKGMPWGESVAKAIENGVDHR